MVKRINWFIVCMLFSIGVTAQAAGKQYNSYKGLVMAGYQGWFNALMTVPVVVGITIPGTTVFAPVLVRLIFGLKYRNIKNCIRRSSSLPMELRPILSLRMMNLRWILTSDG